MEFDELFDLVREYTMEEAGIWEFFSAFQDQFRQILYLHFHVFVNSRTRSGKYYTYISMYPLIRTSSGKYYTVLTFPCIR